MTYEEAYELAFKEQKDSLSAKQKIYDTAVENLMDSDEAFRKATIELSKIGAQTAVFALSGDTKKLLELQNRLNELNVFKFETIKKNGIKPVEFNCSACEDTGYVSGKICDCIKKKANLFYVQSISKEIPINSCKFENFDLDFYSDEKVGNTTPKKRMTAIFKFCKEYVINFLPGISENLLFSGNTGIGKTHLSLSIAGDLLQKGYNVYYESAFNLFSKIEKEHFSSGDNATYNRALNCDLLIIDDLGSEFVSSFVQSVLYNIVNTRILSKKPMIINTNLSMSGIEDMYSPRVSSRFMGEFTSKKFLGNDIRQLKKK